MRRYGREQKLEVSSTVTDAGPLPASRPACIHTDQRPPASSSATQQRRRRPTDTRHQLMGCVSGQRSPTTPTASSAMLDLGGGAGDVPPICSSRPPIDRRAAARDRHSPRPSKYYCPALSIYSDQIIRGSSTLVSATVATSVASSSSSGSGNDSGIDVNSSGSSEKDDVDRRRPLTTSRSRSRSSKTSRQSAAGHAPLSTRQITADDSVEPPEVVSASKRDRKSRSQSPAALWRSISSSSLMRSLSRRRAASKSRAAAAAAAAGGSEVEAAPDRPKLSSVDTEDSDCENRDDRTRRRRIGSGSGGGSLSGSGGSLTAVGLAEGDSRRRCESSTAGTMRRKSGIFGGRSFLRGQSTSGVDDSAGYHSATLPRRQNSGRRSERSESPAALRVSGRASSWASLRRSQTSDSLSHLKTQTSLSYNGFYLVATLNLSEFMVGRFICGMAVTDKHELVVVDLRSAYLVDSFTGRLIRVVGGSGRGGAAGRLVEPIGAAAAADGRLVFSDRGDQTAKLYTGRGQHVRTVTGLGLSNVGGVTVERSTGDVYVAGSDCHGVALVRGAALPGSGRADVDVKYLSAFEHPYSVAFSPTSGDVIVGDDHAQTVTCLMNDENGGHVTRWRWCPPSNSGDQRPFFPSAVAVDSTSGHVFVADLYNEKIYWMDSTGGGGGGGAVLTRGAGLRGGPAAMAVDGVRRLLYVADEERTVHVFSYSAADPHQLHPVGVSAFDRQGSTDEVFC